ENPEGEALPANYVFVPLRVAVDYADRVYVIAQNMFQGILVFDPTGEFSGFFGTINVTVTMWQRFWRAIASRAERANSVLFVPTEFTGLDIDPTGFVYASNIDPDGVKAVRRLNPRGEDVAKTGIFANLGGDLNINGNGIYGGASRIVDVTYVGRGIYALLDSQRGRIFAYDREGNLLYIFGGLGTQQGSFRAPSAIESANGTILVLDSVRNEIVVFSPTEYGALINEAVGLRFDGDEALAVEMWRRVLLLNENLEIANAGIGKAYLTAGDNAAALSYLELGMNRTYYSIAWKRFRNDVLKDSLAWILSGIVAIAAIWFIVRKLTKRGKKREDILADG
ncbi:MAG: gluconolactonase, partial [Oscillospiraceae bacterium]|nr:gluconolactonase [Oscillospiraceae bacterium]